jgi:predicted dinucleotide-binding enzyme
MTIAILGAGNVGAALATSLTAKGETVHLGVPDPAKYAALAERLGGRARIGTVAQALDGTELTILAVPYEAALDLASSQSDWGGRVLIDATNPLAPRLADLSVGGDSSGAEEIAKRAHNARVVKAFNTTGAENMVEPRTPAGPICMPVAGDDAQARARAMALAALIGFDPVDAGPLKNARYLEPMAMLWIQMAFMLGHGRDWGWVRGKK